MKRSLQSVCNKACHVVVFAKQALIADTAPVFLRFAWPADAFQIILLCRVFTAAGEEIICWLERMRTVLRGKTPRSGRLHQFSVIFTWMASGGLFMKHIATEITLKTNATTVFSCVGQLSSWSHYLFTGWFWLQVQPEIRLYRLSTFPRSGGGILAMVWSSDVNPTDYLIQCLIGSS